MQEMKILFAISFMNISLYYIFVKSYKALWAYWAVCKSSFYCIKLVGALNKPWQEVYYSLTPNIGDTHFTAKQTEVVKLCFA